jgi:serine/threonine-protein kinase
MAMPSFLEIQSRDFRVLQRIAVGGGGEVFLAEGMSHELKNLGPFVAKFVKTPKDNTTSRKFVRSFQQEIAIMSLFREHENIAKLIGYCSTPPVILVKYYDLGSLERLMEIERRTKRFMMPLMLGIARGLRLLHWNGIVHCDLKPGNVLIEINNTGLNAVLSDFGISRVVEEKVLTVSAFETIELRGLTYAYAAPEVLVKFKTMIELSSGSQVKQRDIYAFALINYVYLTGSELYKK